MTAPAAGPMHLAFIANDGYLTHAAAMLDSVLEHNRDEALVLHLLHDDGLSPGKLLQLANWLASRGAVLKAHAVPAAMAEGWPDRHFHRSVWFRILLPELLTDLPRVLYLDADTLVLDRLRPLWETDLGGHLFGAVTNPLYPFMGDWPLRQLDVPGPERYLNSGVLLMDLAAMRRDDFVATLRAYAARHPDNRFPEQDALTACYHGRCLFLHPRWNVQTTFYDLPAGQLPFPQGLVNAAREQPAIAHFIGPFKPDHYLSRHPCGERYLRHRGNTPWPARRTGRTPLNLLLRRLPMRWQYRFFVARAALLGG